MADKTQARPLDPAVFDNLRQAGIATVTMQLLKRGIRLPYVNGALPLNPVAADFVAEAYTLRMIPMREDLSTPEVLADPDYPQRHAVEHCPPGQALICDCRGETRAGALGDILITRLMKRGVAAFVADGPMRDAQAVAKIDFPVFCAGGTAPASLAAHFAADTQRPIACGGVAVFPGDILMGDPNGVVVIPRAMAAEVAAGSREQEEMERFILWKIQQGAPAPGTYPPNAQTLAEYEAWKSGKGDGP